GYVAGVRTALRHTLITMMIFLALGFVAWRSFQQTPTSFLPPEDQGLFIAAALLPDGASLDRTNELLRRAETVIGQMPAVEDVTTLGGYDFLSGGGISGNAGAMFVKLKPFSERSASVQDVINQTMAAMAGDPRGMLLAFNPPAIPGLGIRAG